MAYKGYRPMLYYGTVDADLADGPGVVFWIMITVSTGEGTLRLRDGRDGSGGILLTIEQSANRDLMVPFDPPLPFERGLFVDAVDHIQDYTVAFDLLEG